MCVDRFSNIFRLGGCQHYTSDFSARETEGVVKVGSICQVRAKRSLLIADCLAHRHRRLLVSMSCRSRRRACTTWIGELRAVLEVNTVVMSPLATPDEAMLFEQGDHLVQAFVAQCDDGKAIWIWIPAPIACKPIRQCEVNGDAKSVWAEPLGTGDESPVKCPGRPGDVMRESGQADSPANLFERH